MWTEHRIEQFIERIIARLGAIEEVLEKQERTIFDACETSDLKEEKPPRRAIFARIATAMESANADVEAYEKPQRNKEYHRQWWSNAAAWASAVFTLFAFCAAAYYACIARRQLDQMIEANKNTRCATLVSALSAAENAYYSREEERAWAEPWLPNSRSTQIANYGKTVGREVRVSIRTSTGVKHFGPITVSPYTYSQAPFMFPANIPANDRLRGDITYVDVFGVSHWVKFCFAFGPKGEMTPCQFGNDEDSNLENPPNQTLPQECLK